MSNELAHRSSSAVEPTGRDTQVWILRVTKAVVVFIYVVVVVNLVLLTLGLLLRLFGASTDAEFTRWVYRNVDRIMEPFRGMFPTHTTSGRSVLDFSLLFAMIVYSIVGIALHALVTWLTDKIVGLRHRQPPGAPTVAQMGPPGVPTTPSPGSVGPAWDDR